MSLKIIWPWNLPKYINGIAVVCDVWAATTNINSLLSKRVDKLFLVNADNVQKAKQKYKNSIVIGQSRTLPKTFFDASNYPVDVEKVQVEGKSVLYMTNNGTRVIEMVFTKKAQKVFSVSFSNIISIAKYLKDCNEKIFLIPAGEVEFSDPKVLEDLACTQILKALLESKKVNIYKSKRVVTKFLKKTYGYQDFDHKSNFDIVFKRYDLPVIPLYKPTKEGWINVINFYPDV